MKLNDLRALGLAENTKREKVVPPPVHIGQGVGGSRKLKPGISKVRFSLKIKDAVALRAAFDADPILQGLTAKLKVLQDKSEAKVEIIKKRIQNAKREIHTLRRSAAIVEAEDAVKARKNAIAKIEEEKYLAQQRLEYRQRLVLPQEPVKESPPKTTD